MRHNVVEEWSRGASFLHRRAPIAKVIPLAVFLVLLATAHRRIAWLAAVLALLLGMAFLAARLPAHGAFVRAAAVLPFTGMFALVSWAAGDPGRAIELVLKSYVSALAVLLVVGTTPLPELVRSLELIKVPGFLLTVVQFLYRYLFVVFEEAAHMKAAAASRGGLSFRGAAGALAVLFARSYGRAEGIHRAMIARGFNGHFRPLTTHLFTGSDGYFAIVAVILPLLARVAAEALP